MNKVYIVTSGEYSDYSIVACFSTKELAQKFIDERENIRNYDINEYDLDINFPIPINYGRVIISKYGRLEILGLYKREIGDNEIPYINYNFKNELVIEIESWDREQLLRRAEEIRTKILLLGEWGDPGLLKNILNMV